MTRFSWIALLAGIAVSTGVGCSKKETQAESVPATTATAAAAATVEPAATGPEQAGAPAGSASAAATPPSTATPTQPAKAESIDACCNAIGAILKSGKGSQAKVAASKASAICPGIAARVKKGEIGRSAGLNLIRGSLAGTTIPPECH